MKKIILTLVFLTFESYGGMFLANGDYWVRGKIVVCKNNVSKVCILVSQGTINEIKFPIDPQSKWYKDLIFATNIIFELDGSWDQKKFKLLSTPKVASMKIEDLFDKPDILKRQKEISFVKPKDN